MPAQNTELDVDWENSSVFTAQLGDGQLHIWRADLHSCALDLNGLSSQEQARAGKFLSELAKRRYIASHLALRGILARYLPIPPGEIEFIQPHGHKPRLANQPAARPVSFSLSRTEDVCLVAVARRAEVGVDIESAIESRFEPGMADQVLTANELATLEAVAPANRGRAFLLAWTRKEAYAKCIGLGLSADLVHAEVGLTQLTALLHGISVSSFTPEPGYLASWASRDELRPSFWNWTP